MTITVSNIIMILSNNKSEVNSVEIKNPLRTNSNKEDLLLMATRLDDEKSKNAKYFIMGMLAGEDSRAIKANDKRTR